MNNKAHLRPEDYDSNGDIIPMDSKEEKGDLISRSALREAFTAWKTMDDYYHDTDCNDIPLSEAFDLIDNAPAAEEIEKPFITECRNVSIEQNLPLYFIYYEETGILEVYVTETKELFEKRRCSKHLPNYKFRDMVINYLDWYSDWKGSAECSITQ